MKPQILALALGSLCCAPGPAGVLAEGAAECADRAVIVEGLAEIYGESRQAIGLASPDAVVEIFASQTGSWTITVTRTDGTTCLIASGQYFERLDAPVSASGDPA